MPRSVSPISNESHRRDKIPIIWKTKSQRISAGSCNDFVTIWTESRPF